MLLCKQITQGDIIKNLLILSIAVLMTTSATAAKPPAMGEKYHENARSVCQLRAHVALGKKFPVQAPSFPASVKSIRNGKALEVVAHDESNGRNSECTCIFVTGDSDLNNTVRLDGEPSCNVS